MEPGTLLGGRFRLGAHRERTRRGESFYARDERTGTPCLVETVLLSGFAGEESEAWFDREVAIGQALDSPGFLIALGWGRMGPEQVFVARAVSEGARPLNLHSGPLEQRVRLLLAATRRVETLASLGGIHRDLGPLTLLLDAGGEVLLTGFRMARFPNVPEPPLDARGLPFSYLPCAAPELLEAPEEAGETADIYALGVLLHMVLCGAGPYPGPTLIHLIRQQDAIRYGRGLVPQPTNHRPNLPPALNALCVQATALDPNDRLPSAAAFAAKLEDWLASASRESVRAVSQSTLLTEALTGEPGQSRPSGLARHAAVQPGTPFPVATPRPQPRTEGLWDPFASDQGKVAPPEEPAAEEPADLGDEAFDLVTPPVEESEETGVLQLEVPRTVEEPVAPGPVVEDPFEADPLSMGDIPAPSDEELDAIADSEEDPFDSGTGPAVEEQEQEEELQPASPQEVLAALDDNTPVVEDEEDEEEELEPASPEEIIAALDNETRADAVAEDVPVPVSPEEALAALEAQAPTRATPAEVLQAFGAPEEEDETPVPASAAEVIAALEAETRGATRRTPSRPMGPPRPAIEDEDTDILPRLPKRTAAQKDPELPADPVITMDDLLAPPVQTGDELEKTESGRVDLGALDLSGGSAGAADADAEYLDAMQKTKSGRIDLGDLDLESSNGLEGSDITVPLAEPPTNPLPSLAAPPPLPDLPPEPEPEPEEDIVLLPPIAFKALKTRADGILVLTMPKRDFEKAVDCAKRIDPKGFTHLLLDMSAVKHLGGSQMEDLTAILTRAERKDLQAFMFALATEVRQVLKIMDDITLSLPKVLEVDSEEAAVALAKR